MKLWHKLILGSGLSLLSGLLLTAAFPPYELWPLAFVGLVPMVIAQYHVFPKAWAGLANALGVGGFFLFYMTLGGLIPFLAWLPLPIAVIAGLVGWRERVFNEVTGGKFLWLTGPIIWVGFGMIRGLVPFFGTWGLLSYTLYNLPWLIQPVAVFSIFGLELLILLINYTLAAGILMAIWKFTDPDAMTLPYLINLRHISLRVGLAALGWTALSLALFQPSDGTLMAAAIHPSVQIQDVEDEAGLALLFDSTRIAARRGAQLIVWHEAALPFDPQVTHTAELQELAAETGAYLSIGYAVQTDEGLRNESAILSPDGSFLSVYAKDHPVLFSGETSVTAGLNYSPAQTSLGAVGSVICYDIEFTDTTRKVARAGAQVITVPSLDWPALASIHYTHVVFRAIENRVSMIKADIGFDSAIIDPHGRILSRVVTPNASVTAILTAEIPPGSGQTLVTRLGDWIGWLALAGLGLFHGADLLISLRGKNHPEGTGNQKGN